MANSPSTLSAARVIPPPPRVSASITPAAPVPVPTLQAKWQAAQREVVSLTAGVRRMTAALELQQRKLAKAYNRALTLAFEFESK